MSLRSIPFSASLVALLLLSGGCSSSSTATAATRPEAGVSDATVGVEGTLTATPLP
jgi:hypothetical protein